MANHVHCKDCWWYEETVSCKYAVIDGRIKKVDMVGGRCYMHPGTDTDYTIVKEDSYCPDYINRKRSKKTLQEWLSEKNLDV